MGIDQVGSGHGPRPSVPHGHWKTATFVAGLRTAGMVAPFVIGTPINRDAFEVYVERVLVPDLTPGDIVIMDNLSSHKGPKVRELIEAAGASLIYVPPYSPRLQPDRERLLEAEGALAKSRAANRGGSVGRHRVHR